MEPLQRPCLKRKARMQTAVVERELRGTFSDGVIFERLYRGSVRRWSLEMQKEEVGDGAKSRNK